MRVNSEVNWRAWITPALELYRTPAGYWSVTFHLGPWMFSVATG